MQQKNAGNNGNQNISKEDTHYINILRGFSILRVVLAHLGLSWFYPPYSQYVGIFLPVLFFVSGAVSYYSFIRSDSLREYLVKRLVLIIIPFYIFAALVLIITALFYSDNFPDGSGLLHWILVWPESGNVFFPLNQVWFINSLIVMILLSAPLFMMSKKMGWTLWLPVVFSLSLSFLNVSFPIYESVRDFPPFSQIGWGFQAWQTLTLFGLFVFGALHYRYLSGQSGKIYALIAVFVFILAIFGYLYSNIGFELTEHTNQRSVYYLLLSFFAIYVLLAVKRPVLALLTRLRYIEYLLLYVNRYAYSVFLLHTLVLFYVEEWLGLSDLGDRPLLALLRMFLVVIITLVVAKPLGDLSRIVAHAVRERLLCVIK